MSSSLSLRIFSCECGGMVDAKASKAFHCHHGVGSNPITRIFLKMDLNTFFVCASAAEAWHSVPLMSLHLPFFGSVLSVNNWLLTVRIAVFV